jgi:HAD superfamily hydrolase (TIGR01509 family)
MPGARELLGWLRGRGVRTALLTRNSRVSVETARTRHGLAIDAIVTRETHTPKPSPEGVQHLMARFGAGADETIVVGDYRYDIEAGRSAGTRTIALIAEAKAWAKDATWIASSLDEVREILQRLIERPVA